MTSLLGPRPDRERLRDAFATSGVVSVTEFLTAAAAEELAAELAGSDAWIEIFRAGDKVYEMPRAAFIALSDPQRSELEEKVHAAARQGLQYRYRAIRIAERAEERAARGLAIDRFADLLNSAPCLALLRDVTGYAQIAFADAQATDYRAGDFLTSHDDEVAGKDRVAAYVFGLTRRWQPDWGGLLLFERDAEVTGYAPGFNVLRLFAVPRPHHVSVVAPWVTARRLSITGWLRASAPA